MSNLPVVNDSEFSVSVLGSLLPVLVDFSATWCQPCQRQAPILEEVSRELTGQVKVFKMDVDDNPETPQKFGVMSVPTLILFKGGAVVEKLVGLTSKEKLLGKLSGVL